MSADEPKRHLSVHDVIGALGDLPEGEDCVSVVRKQRDAADRPSVTDNARAEHRKGANAEDCPACYGSNPPYPWICPGDDRWAAGRAETVGNDGLTDTERQEYARQYRTGPAFKSIRTPLDDAGRAETTTEDYPDAEGLAALRENAETTTATTEDVARLLQRYAARESVVIFDGAAQEIAQALADAGLLATARTRPTETEWGVRWRPDDYEAAPDEDTARLWAASDTGHPVALVRREVTAWTEADR